MKQIRLKLINVNLKTELGIRSVGYISLQFDRMYLTNHSFKIRIVNIQEVVQILDDELKASITSV